MPTHNFKVTADENNSRLDVFLTRRLPDVPSRSFVQKLIEGGYVKVNEAPVKSGHKVLLGEDVNVEVPKDFLTPSFIAPQDIPIDIFYEDEYLFVINKPSGLLVHPASGQYTDTLVNAMRFHAQQLSTINSDIRPGIVHRLDQDTSGLMLIAKDNITHTKLAKMFNRHEIEKQYIALVEGVIDFDEGKVDVPIGTNPRHRDKKTVRFDDAAKDAVTYYRVLRRTKDVSLVALFPQTGRTHQLRVHMKHIGHPILGDEKYGHSSTFTRLALHAQAIAFRHPMTEEHVEFVSCPPQEFLQRVA